MAEHDDPRNPGRETPITRRDEKVALLREMTEALTALGNYLEGARHEFEKRPAPRPEAFGEALQKSFGQYERAVKAVRRLRELLHKDPSNNDRQGID